MTLCTWTRAEFAPGRRHRKRLSNLLCAGLVHLWTLAAAAAADDSALRDAIRNEIDTFAETGELWIEGAPVAARQLLPELYEARSFEAAWTDEARAEQALRSLASSVEDGLDPEDYHLSALRGLKARLRDPQNQSAAAIARYELLITDGLARQVYHLEFGKVSPARLMSSWNLSRQIDGLDGVKILQEIMRAPSVQDAVAAHRPQSPFYRRGLAALTRYRSIATAGGWEPIAEGPALKKGMRDARVAQLRARLVASGDLAEASRPSLLFDEALEAAVVAFQTRNLLDTDGVAGKGTLAELSVPVEQRIAQLRVNLERGRWTLHDLPSDFVLVDIAGFEARLVRDDRIVWRTRVQVGRPYRKTPVFKDRIRYLEFNPTWTIPPGILRRDTLPAVKQDPSYLVDRNIRVIGSGGRELRSESVDWSRYPAERFPYRLVQDPGPNNALGRVKFMFPNPHLVFLHDTPSRSLFAQSDRAFSSGCVRVENPFELARLLLDDEETWSAAAIQALVDSKQTQAVSLAEPKTVIILYWTIALPPEGGVGFKRDLYDRDGAVLAALDGPFEVHASPRAP